MEGMLVKSFSKNIDIFDKVCYNTRTERSLTSVKVAVAPLWNPQGSIYLFSIYFPDASQRGGDCVNYLTLTDFINMLMLLLAFGTFILAFFNNDRKR